MAIIITSHIAFLNDASAGQAPVSGITEDIVSRSKLEKTYCPADKLIRQISRSSLGSQSYQSLAKALGFDKSIRCFRLHVPENYQRPTSRLVSFPILKVEAKYPDPTLTPILHLGAGGPGVSRGIADDADFDRKSIQDWYDKIIPNEDRDLFILDPRGTPFAHPKLDCEEAREVFFGFYAGGHNDDINNVYLDAIKACINRLKTEGVDLSSFNSHYVANDVEVLRTKLEVEKWNLYGVSYASRYAQTIAREFPESVESMVLVSPKFTNISYTEDYAINFQLALETMIDVCVGDTLCQKVIPDTANRFWEIIDEYRTSPIYFEFDHPQTAQRQRVQIDSAVLLHTLFRSIYLHNHVSTISSFVSNLEEDELGLFENNIKWWISDHFSPRHANLSDLVHYCREEFPFQNYKKSLETARQTRRELRSFATGVIKFGHAVCGMMQVSPAQAIESEPIYVAAPTLILSGELDPVLPVRYLEDQLQYFSDVESRVFPNTSHYVFYRAECIPILIAGFFGNQRDQVSELQCEVE